MRYLASLLLAFVLAMEPLIAYAAMTDNLVANWNMNETSGARADNSSNAFTLTENGTVSSAAGIISNGATDWSDANYLSRANNSLFDLTGAWSMCFWIKGSSYTASSEIAGKDASGGTSGWRVFIASGVNVTFQSPVNTTNYIDDASITANAWNFYCLTSSDGAHLTIFKNGSQSTANQAITTPSTNSDEVRIGRRVTGQTNNLAANNVVDEVSFWTRALTPTEVNTLYNSGAGLAFPWATTAAFNPSRFWEF